MSIRTRSPSGFAALMVGVWVVCFCLFAAEGAEVYSFVKKWPDIPEAWRFAGPNGVAVDSSGNVFVADTGNDRIRKFDSSGSLLSEWGSHGSGDGELSSPHGIAVDSSGDVFVVDTANYRVQKFDSSGNFLGKWGSRGSGDGQFWGGEYGTGPGPLGIAVDTSGNVFVADTENHRIQEFDSSGNFLRKWGAYGTADGKFSSPQGISVDSSGSVFVADTGNHRIQRFDSAGGFLRKWGLPGSGDGEFRYPRGVAVDSSGTVFVTDSENERIQVFDSQGNFLGAWGERGSGDGQFGGLPGWTGTTPGPSGIALDSSGEVFVADTYNDRIEKFHSSGSFVAKWGYRGSADGEFDEPGSIAVGPSGNIFVVDTGNYRVQKFESSGNFVAKWGSKGSGNGEFSWPFVWPPGVVADSSGNVFVADTGNARIQKFDSSGNFLWKWSYYDPGGGAPLQPYGVAVDSSGNVFATDGEHCWVIEFDSWGNFIRKWGSLGSGDGEFTQPRGIAVDSSGNVYVADAGNHRIQKFDSSGNFAAKWGSEGSGDGELSGPYGVAVDSSGNVYVADAGNHRIQKFDSSGNFLAKWGSRGFGDGEFDEPHGVAVDSSGDVFVADSGNSRVQQFRRVRAAISRQPESLSNLCDQGDDAPSQNFEVWNSGELVLSYAITDDVPWLFCTPSSGTSDGEHDSITVNYSTSGLEPGTYSATITITDPDASNSPQHVDVTLTVRAKEVAIGLQPASLYSSCDRGENAPPKSFEAWNAGPGTLSYTITDDVPWLFCTPSSGTSDGEHDIIMVIFNTAGLEPGEYSAKITVSDPKAGNSPRQIDVTLTVRPAAATIGCQPASLSNSCDEGQDAHSQRLEVWNSGGGTLHYIITDDAAWLSCSPAVSTSVGEHDTITASYDTSALEPGNYSVTITVSDPNATNSPQTIGVSLTVHAVTPEGTVSAGSATTVQGDQTSFPVTISLDLAYDLTYLAVTVEFPPDSFTALGYAKAGRVEVDPAEEGIDNTTGEVRLTWLSLTGETVIPAGSGHIATIEFKQNTGASEGTYQVVLSGVEARYGPQEYRLELVNGQIRIIRGSLDVDGNGSVEPATDIVYIYRYLVEMPATVPSQFREIDPSIPSDDEIETQIEGLRPLLDVDASGGEPDPGTDIVYIYRYLVGMPTTVPTSFRELDPTIPPDEEINARIDAINVPKAQGVSPQERVRAAALAIEAGGDVLRVAHVAGQRGGSIAVPISLDAPDEDLSYLRLWIEYDETRLTPRELLKAGRTSVEPMPDWLDKENGRIRAVLESLEGDVVIPGGAGPVIEVVFDVVEDTTTSDSLHIDEEVEAGLGPKRVAVAVSPPVAIAPGPSGAVSLSWQPFGGGSYTVVCCEDLLGGDWVPVEGFDWPIPQTSWQTGPVPDVRRRFYRVKSE